MSYFCCDYCGQKIHENDRDEEVFVCEKCGREICAFCNSGDPDEGTDLCEDCASDPSAKH